MQKPGTIVKTCRNDSYLELLCVKEVCFWKNFNTIIQFSGTGLTEIVFNTG